MAGFNQKLAKQGITPHQFAFQFVVVLLGVYLAIFFEGKAQSRAEEQDARAMLESVLREIELDENDISEVLADQREMEESYATLAGLLTIASSNEEPAIDSLLLGPFSFNPTVFPRRAAYTALVASGGLAAVSSKDLALALADLYEHHYVRLVTMGELHDKNFGEFYEIMNYQGWDRTGHRLIERGAEANVVFRNGADNGRTMAQAYQNRLTDVLERVRSVKEVIQAYLAQ